MKVSFLKFGCVSFLLILITCQKGLDENVNINSDSNNIEQVEIRRFKLPAKLAQKTNEFSGLCWSGNELLILPQYPFGLGDNSKGKLFAITKSEINSSIENDFKDTLKYFTYKIEAFKLEIFNKISSGFEGMVVIDSSIYFLLESVSQDSSIGYLVKGSIDTLNKHISISGNEIVKIPSQTNIYNFTEEAITTFENKIIVFNELYGKNINHFKRAHLFDYKLSGLEYLKFPTIEYRITDATMVGEDSTFYAVNYYYPGEKDIIHPAVDEILEKSNDKGKFYQNNVIERIIKFKIKRNEIVFSDTSPIVIKNRDDGIGRNWEGIVKLDSIGFLLISDYYPSSIFAFIPFKLEE